MKVEEVKERVPVVELDVEEVESKVPVVDQVDVDTLQAGPLTCTELAVSLCVVVETVFGRVTVAL
jgi:hypothetical protein